MNDLRTSAQQALEVEADRRRKALAAEMRAALAQQAEPVGPRWEGDDNITSPWNACMHKNYCVALKEERERRLAQQAERTPPDATAGLVDDLCLLHMGWGDDENGALERIVARARAVRKMRGNT